MKLPVVDGSVAGKRVFVRGDIDVPITNNQDTRYKIQDDTRLKDIWPTIDFLLKQNCTVLLAGHLGRPGGKEDVRLSSKPVAEWFQHEMQDTGYKTQEVSGVCLRGNICGFLISDRLTVLENLRFDPREEADPSASSGQVDEYAKELASLAEVYVNESFAESYRETASIVGVPKLLPHFAGFRLAKEIEVLSGLLENPQRPLLVIIGGAKLDTKLPVIAKMAEHADTVIVGGKLLENADQIQDIGDKAQVKKLELGEGGKDVTTESIDKIADIIAEAKTIVWNGPLGAVEEIAYQVGTRRVAELITANSGAYKVVGGGDTVAFLDKVELTSKFDWVSSGGGSMLKSLSGEKLPGLEALAL